MHNNYTQIILIMADMALFAVSVLLALTFRHMNIEPWVFYRDNLITLLPLFFSVPVTAYIFYLYDTDFLRNNRYKTEMLSTLALNLVFGFIYLYFFKNSFFEPTPKIVLILAFVIYAFLFCGVRKFYIKTFLRILPVKNIFLLGSGPAITRIKEALSVSKEYKITGAAKDYRSLTAVPPDVDTLVVSFKNWNLKDGEFWNFISETFIKNNISVEPDFHVYESLLHRVSEESLEYPQFVLEKLARRKRANVYLVLKRLFDLSAALLLSAAALIPFGTVWAYIKIFYRLDPLFRQKRIGYRGSEFEIYKFITLKPKTEEVAPQNIFGEYKKEQSEYLPFGKFLRRYRLDEIPNLINVIKGDMSFIGPRPVWDVEYKASEHAIHNYVLRTVVRPGISGWAQLNFRAVRNIDDVKTRFCYDMYYIENISFAMDLDITLKTIKRVFLNDKKVN